MHRFSRMHLSPEVVHRTLVTVDREENSKVAEWIALVAVTDQRRDYLAAGYSSMLGYCMGELSKSEDQALRRIQIARKALRFPELFECLADGRLGVTTASLLAPHLEPETAAGLLAAAARRTKREILRMLAEWSRPLAPAPVAPAGEEVVETTSCQHAPAHVGSLADLCGVPASGCPETQHAAPHVARNSRRGRVTDTATGGREVRLSLTDAEYEDLRAAMDLDAHAVPSGDPALVYARAMKLYRAHLEKRRLGVKPGADVPAGCGRGIPRALRRRIWERDGGRCTFVSADGHRCEETRRLEIDHVTPVARGGRATADNLRVLCRAHNQYEAERVLGKEHVQSRRELAERARARDRAAAEAGVAREEARTQARDVAQQARYDDIRAALRGLGSSGAEARRGAAMADDMPDASLEACVRAALTELTRGVVLRSEQRARCSA